MKSVPRASPSGLLESFASSPRLKRIGNGDRGVPVFRMIVSVETGERLCPLYVNAANRSAAIDLARAEGLIMNGERASIIEIEHSPISLDFGSIAIG